MNNKLISFNGVKDISNLSRSTIYRLEQEGKFPKRITFSNRCVRWSLSEVQDWVDSKIEGRV